MIAQQDREEQEFCYIRIVAGLIGQVDFTKQVNALYADIVEECKEKDQVQISVQHTTTPLLVNGEPWLVVSVTVHVVGREELAAQQRRAELAGGPPQNGGGPRRIR
mgnify:CR=1 FL=1